MWQIMWMLALLPDWFWHVLTISGVLAVFASWLLKRIPFISQYNLPIKIVGTVAVLLSVWMEGGISNEAKWQAKVAELEAKVKLAEEQANNKNVEVQEKVVTKTKVIKERGKDIVQYIDREVIKKEEIVKYIEQCPVPKEIIDLHNQATELNKAAEGKK
jgi:hypothetical protein